MYRGLHRICLFLTLRTFCKTECNVHVNLGVDNTTCVHYLNKQGGRKRDLNEICRQIWGWAVERNIWLSASHVPGILNVEADTASRKQYAYEGEWQLDPNVFKAIDEQFGPVEIDLFATRLNSQCKKYFSWKSDPDAIACDAFLQDWDFNIMYAFPPFSVIGRLLQRVEEMDSVVLAVLPLWPAQQWFGRALRLSVDDPRLLPYSLQLLRLPQEPRRTHPLMHKVKHNYKCARCA